MQRLRFTALVVVITLFTLLMVGGVLAQSPTPSVPTTQTVATPRRAVSASFDRQQRVYVSLAEEAMGHVIDLAQVSSASALATPRATAVSPLAVGTPTAGSSAPATQDLVNLVLNMRAVLQVSERGLDDLEAQAAGAGTTLACPNLGDEMRIADTVLQNVLRTLRSSSSALDARVISQLVQSRGRLQGALACLNTSLLGGPVAPSTTQGTLTPNFTPAPTTLGGSVATPRVNAQTTATPTASGPADTVGRAFEQLRESLERLFGGGAPTPTPVPVR